MVDRLARVGRAKRPPPAGARQCPLCGGSADRLRFPYESLWKDQLYRHLSCSSCRATYVDPLPSQQQLADVYTWEGYHAKQNAHVDVAKYTRTVEVLARHRPPT